MDHLKKADFEAKCKAKEKEYLKDYLVTKGIILRKYRGARLRNAQAEFLEQIFGQNHDNQK